MSAVDIDDSNTEKTGALRIRLSGLWVRARDYLARNNYVPLWHAISIVLILVASLFLFNKSFSQPGILMHADMCWPTSMDRIGALYTNTWLPYGSGTNIWNVQRVFWTYPLLTVAKILNFSVQRYLLVQFICTWWIAGISMYCLALFVLRSVNIRKSTPAIASGGAVLAAVIYMYNPWCILHSWGYFMAPSYALLPLAFIFMVKSLEKPSPRNVIIVTLIMTLGSTGPIGVVWLWLPFVAYALYYVVINRFKAEIVISSLKVLAGSLVLYLFLNAMWIAPYLQAQFTGKSFTPAYMPYLSKSMIDLTSGNTTIVNNLRLLSGWGWPVGPFFENSLWKLLSFALPVISIIALLALGKKAWKNRHLLFCALMWIFLILMGTGSTFILGRFYTYLFLEAPGSGLYGWIIRYPNRWLFFVPVFYALMAGLLIVKLLSEARSCRKTVLEAVESPASPVERDRPGHGEEILSEENRVLRAEIGAIKRKLSIVQGRALAFLAVLVVLASIFSMLPLADMYAKKVYNPTRIPADYNEVNRFVAEQGGADRVVWMPFFKGDHLFSWSDNKQIGLFNVYSSAPSINNLALTDAPETTYFLWLETVFSHGNEKDAIYFADGLNIPGNDAAAMLLMPFSAGYLIVDRSRSGGSGFNENLVKDTSLSKVKQTEYLDVFKIAGKRAFISAATATVKVNSIYDCLSIMRKLPEDRRGDVVFVNDDASADRIYGSIDLEDYQETLNQNPGFQEWNAIWGPIGWINWGDPEKSSVEEDTLYKVSGDRSIKVKNSAAGEFDLAWVYGNEVPVHAGEIYALESNVKYKNSNWTHVVIQGYDTGRDEWVELVKCPNIGSGTTDWKNYECSFIMPPGISRVRVMLAAGWAKDPSKGPAVSWFDNITFSAVSGSLFGELGKKGDPPAVTFKRVSDEKYTADIKGAEGPFVLAMSESFDPHWIARVEGGDTVEPVPLYSIINGFPIDKNGDFRVTIEYGPQKWFTAGLVISLVSLLFCLIYLAWLWDRKAGFMSRFGKHLSRGGSKVRFFVEAPPRHTRHKGF